MLIGSGHPDVTQLPAPPTACRPVDSLTGPGQGGNLGDMLGQVLGGGRPGSGSRYGGPQSRGAQGGLGGILDNLTNKARTGGSAGGSGGLGDLLNQLGGGSKTRSAGAGGGLGDLLGGLLGGAAAGGVAGSLARKDSQPTNDASFGELFNDAVINKGEPEVAPTPEQNAVAGLMLRAMIQAAKADGRIDEASIDRLTDFYTEVGCDGVTVLGIQIGRAHV